MEMRMEDFGLSPKNGLRFLAATEDMKSLYSLTVVKDGRTLLDQYFKPFLPGALPGSLFGVQGVVSLAVGVAVDQEAAPGGSSGGFLWGGGCRGV